MNKKGDLKVQKKFKLVLWFDYKSANNTEVMK